MPKKFTSLILFFCLLLLSGCSTAKSAHVLLHDDLQAEAYPSAVNDLMLPTISEETKLSNRTKFSEDGSGLLGLKKSDLSMMLGDADELGFKFVGLVFAEENSTIDNISHLQKRALESASLGVIPKNSAPSQKSWYSELLSAAATPAKHLLYELPLEYVRIYWLHDGSNRALATHSLAVSMLNNRVVRSSACWSIGPINEALGLAVCVLVVCCIKLMFEIYRRSMDKIGNRPLPPDTTSDTP